MLDTLKFVRGAVSEKDVVPVLTHFCIYKKRIQGANGRVEIDSPCAQLDFEAVVPADRFLRAVDACAGEPTLRFTEGGKLVVERKPFRALLPIQPISAFPLAQPSKGKPATPAKPIFPYLRKLRPFMSDDAERPWASTALFADDAFVSNNATIAMMTGNPFKHEIQLPVFGVDELLRIGLEPKNYVVDEVSVTFFWDEGWLRVRKISAEWPVKTAQQWMATKVKTDPIPKNLAAAVMRVVPFCNDPKHPIIYLKKKGVSTAPGEVQAEVSGFDLPEAAAHADNLLAMLKPSSHMGATDKAVIFTGPDGFKGIMSILRTA